MFDFSLFHSNYKNRCLERINPLVYSDIYHQNVIIRPEYLFQNISPAVKMVYKRWNSHPPRGKCFTSHFFPFLLQISAICATKTQFLPLKHFSLSCFFNFRLFYFFSGHIFAINAQKSVFLSFQNISTIVDSIFISWMADSTWGICFKLLFAYTIHSLCIASGGIESIFNFHFVKLQI